MFGFEHRQKKKIEMKKWKEGKNNKEKKWKERKNEEK